MRPSRTREEKAQKQLYINEEELKKEFQRQAEEKRRIRKLEDLREKEETLQHYLHCKIGNNITGAAIDEEGIKRDEIELAQIAQQRQELEQQGNMREDTKRNEKVQLYYSKQQEEENNNNNNFLFSNDPTSGQQLSKGEIERKKRLQLREEERKRRLQGQETSAYDQKKQELSLPFKIDQQIQMQNGGIDDESKRQKRLFNLFDEPQDAPAPLPKQQPQQQIQQQQFQKEDKYYQKDDQDMTHGNSNIENNTAQDSHILPSQQGKQFLGSPVDARMYRDNTEKLNRNYQSHKKHEIEQEKETLKFPVIQQAVQSQQQYEQQQLQQQQQQQRGREMTEADIKKEKMLKYKQELDQQKELKNMIPNSIKPYSAHQLKRGGNEFEINNNLNNNNNNNHNNSYNNNNNNNNYNQRQQPQQLEDGFLDKFGQDTNFRKNYQNFNNKQNPSQQVEDGGSWGNREQKRSNSKQQQQQEYAEQLTRQVAEKQARKGSLSAVTRSLQDNNTMNNQYNNNSYNNISDLPPRNNQYQYSQQQNNNYIQPSYSPLPPQNGSQQQYQQQQQQQGQQQQQSRYSRGQTYEQTTGTDEELKAKEKEKQRVLREDLERQIQEKARQKEINKQQDDFGYNQQYQGQQSSSSQQQFQQQQLPQQYQQPQYQNSQPQYSDNNINTGRPAPAQAQGVSYARSKVLEKEQMDPNELGAKSKAQDAKQRYAEELKQQMQQAEKRKEEEKQKKKKQEIEEEQKLQIQLEEEKRRVEAEEKSKAKKQQELDAYNVHVIEESKHNKNKINNNINIKEALKQSDHQEKQQSHQQYNSPRPIENNHSNQNKNNYHFTQSQPQPQEIQESVQNTFVNNNNNNNNNHINYSQQGNMNAMNNQNMYNNNNYHHNQMAQMANNQYSPDQQMYLQMMGMPVDYFAQAMGMNNNQAGLQYLLQNKQEIEMQRYIMEEKLRIQQFALQEQVLIEEYRKKLMKAQAEEQQFQLEIHRIQQELQHKTGKKVNSTILSQVILQDYSSNNNNNNSNDNQNFNLIKRKKSFDQLRSSLANFNENVKYLDQQQHIIKETHQSIWVNNQSNPLQYKQNQFDFHPLQNQHQFSHQQQLQQQYSQPQQQQQQQQQQLHKPKLPNYEANIQQLPYDFHGKDAQNSIVGQGVELKGESDFAQLVSQSQFTKSYLKDLEAFEQQNQLPQQQKVHIPQPLLLSKSQKQNQVVLSSKDIDSIPMANQQFNAKNEKQLEDSPQKEHHNISANNSQNNNSNGKSLFRMASPLVKLVPAIEELPRLEELDDTGKSNQQSAKDESAQQQDDNEGEEEEEEENNNQEGEYSQSIEVQEQTQSWHDSKKIKKRRNQQSQLHLQEQEELNQSHKSVEINIEFRENNADFNPRLYSRQKQLPQQSQWMDEQPRQSEMINLELQKTADYYKMFKQHIQGDARESQKQQSEEENNKNNKSNDENQQSYDDEDISKSRLSDTKQEEDEQEESVQRQPSKWEDEEKEQKLQKKKKSTEQQSQSKHNRSQEDDGLGQTQLSDVQQSERDATFQSQQKSHLKPIIPLKQQNPNNTGGAGGLMKMLQIHSNILANSQMEKEKDKAEKKKENDQSQGQKMKKTDEQQNNYKFKRLKELRDDTEEEDGQAIGVLMALKEEQGERRKREGESWKRFSVARDWEERKEDSDIPEVIETKLRQINIGYEEGDTQLHQQQQLQQQSLALPEDDIEQDKIQQFINSSNGGGGANENYEKLSDPEDQQTLLSQDFEDKDHQRVLELQKIQKSLEKMNTESRHQPHSHSKNSIQSHPKNSKIVSPSVPLLLQAPDPDSNAQKKSQQRPVSGISLKSDNNNNNNNSSNAGDKKVQSFKKPKTIDVFSKSQQKLSTLKKTKEDVIHDNQKQISSEKLVDSQKSEISCIPMKHQSQQSESQLKPSRILYNKNSKLSNANNNVSRHNVTNQQQVANNNNTFTQNNNTIQTLENNTFHLHTLNNNTINNTKYINTNITNNITNIEQSSEESIPSDNEETKHLDNENIIANNNNITKMDDITGIQNNLVNPSDDDDDQADRDYYNPNNIIGSNAIINFPRHPLSANQYYGKQSSQFNKQDVQHSNYQKEQLQQKQQQQQQQLKSVRSSSQSSISTGKQKKSEVILNRLENLISNLEHSAQIDESKLSLKKKQ